MHIIYFDPDWRIFILASDAATDNAFLMHLNYWTEEARRLIVKKVDFILTNQKKICVQKNSATKTIYFLFIFIYSSHKFTAQSTLAAQVLSWSP